MYIVISRNVCVYINIYAYICVCAHKYMYVHICIINRYINKEMKTAVIVGPRAWTAA